MGNGRARFDRSVVKMEENEFTLISWVFGSPKRLRILATLDKHSRRYTQFEKELRPEVSTSELYKHLEILVKNGLVIEAGKVWMITAKGVEFLRGTQNLLNMLRGE